MPNIFLSSKQAISPIPELTIPNIGQSMDSKSTQTIRFGNFKIQRVIFIKNENINDFTNCDGEYNFKDNEVFHGEPVFFNFENNRILIKSEKSWVITSTDNYKSILKEQPCQIGGFHYSNEQILISQSSWLLY